MLEKLKKDKHVFGTWIKMIRTPYIAQIFATAGFDFIYIDMEHGNFNMETVADICSYALLSGIIPIVRPASKEPCMMTRPLDSGALGLLIPQVDSKKDAEEIIRSVKYPPIGNRGASTRGIHTNFSKVSAEEFAIWANSNQIIIIQIESQSGIDEIDDILSVEGIDGAVVGRGDLSKSIGLAGQTTHPEVIKRVEIVIDACIRHNVYPGLLVHDIQSAKQWINKGIKIVPYSHETDILVNEGTRIVRELNGLVE